MSYAESYYFSGNRLRDLLFPSPSKFLRSSYAVAMNTGQSRVKQLEPENAPSSPSPKRKRTSAETSQSDRLLAASELSPGPAAATATFTSQDAAYKRNDKAPHSMNLVGPSQTLRVGPPPETKTPENAASKHNNVRPHTEIDSPKANSEMHRKASQVTVPHTPPSQGRPAKKRRFESMENLTAADILATIPSRRADVKESPGEINSPIANPEVHRLTPQVAVPRTPPSQGQPAKKRCLEGIKNLTAADILATIPSRRADAKESPGRLKRHPGRETPRLNRDLIQVSVPSRPSRSEEFPRTTAHNEPRRQSLGRKQSVQVVVPSTPSRSEKTPETIVHNKQEGYFMKPKPLVQVVVPRTPLQTEKAPRAAVVPKAQSEQEGHSMALKQQEDQSPIDFALANTGSPSGNEANAFGLNNSRPPQPETAQHKTHYAEEPRQSIEKLTPANKLQIQEDASQFARTSFLNRLHEHKDYQQHIQAPRMAPSYSARQFEPSPEETSLQIPPRPNQSTWTEQQVPKQHQEDASQFAQTSFLNRLHEHKDYQQHIQAPPMAPSYSACQFKPPPKENPPQISTRPNQSPWTGQKAPEHQNPPERLDRYSHQHLPMPIQQSSNPPVSNALISVPPVPPQSHTNSSKATFTPNVISDKSYLKREPRIVQPINDENAEKRASYNPTTIASDILIASGRHRTEPPLNYHLLPLRDAFPFVKFSSDLATFRWDWVDSALTLEEHITRNGQPSGWG